MPSAHPGAHPSFRECPSDVSFDACVSSSPLILRRPARHKLARTHPSAAPPRVGMACSSSAALVGQKVIVGVPPRARAASARRGASVPVRASIAEPEPSQTKPGYFQRKKEKDAKVFTRKKLANLISPTPSDIVIAQARPRRSAPRRARPFARFQFVVAIPKIMCLDGTRFIELTLLCTWSIAGIPTHTTRPTAQSSPLHME